MANQTSLDASNNFSPIPSLAEEPAITFETLTFSDGTTINLDSQDIVVFVGPNNAGKSAALRELEIHIGPPIQQTVIRSVSLKKTGTPEQLLKYIESCADTRGAADSKAFYSYKFAMSAKEVSRNWQNSVAAFRAFFCMRITTDTRLKDSDPAPAINILNDSASHPIHMLFADDTLESRIGQHFRRAFGEDLILFRLGGSAWPLLVGSRLAPQPSEDRLSRRYNEALRSSTVELHKQGDGMRSFASVILHLLAPITPSVLLLDEPEAFLHPPQARLLGEVIAKERSPRAQLFVATHSPDVLQGLLNVGTEHLRVLRITREGNINKVKELDKDRAKKIATDPIMKYSSILSGAFYKRIIVTESDADCMFYSIILDRVCLGVEQHPDVMFVHANGKDRIPKLIEALADLGIPVDVIVDMDILRDNTVMMRIVQGLRGEWEKIKIELEPLKKFIEHHKPWLTATEIKNDIITKLQDASTDALDISDLRTRIDASFRKASPWDAIKESGESAIPSGQATQHYKALERMCKNIKLWIVPVGELEGFCRSVGGHGPKWVQTVIEQHDIATSPDLDPARQFVRELWDGLST